MPIAMRLLRHGARELPASDWTIRFSIFAATCRESWDGMVRISRTLVKSLFRTVPVRLICEITAGNSKSLYGRFRIYVKANPGRTDALRLQKKRSGKFAGAHL